MACLTQLSSLNGFVFGKKEDRLNYLSNYVTHFLKFLQGLGQSGTIQPNEALGCSNIVRKVMLFFPPAIMTNLHPQVKAIFRKFREITLDFKWFHDFF